MHAHMTSTEVRGQLWSLVVRREGKGLLSIVVILRFYIFVYRCTAFMHVCKPCVFSACGGPGGHQKKQFFH